MGDKKKRPCRFGGHGHGGGRTRAEMGIAGIVLGAMLSISGCAELQVTATQRASRELACPESQLTVVNRSDIDSNLFDVSGCGRAARYMCFQQYRSEPHCTREPEPDPAEQAARQAAASASASASPSPTAQDKPVLPKDHPFPGN